MRKLFIILAIPLLLWAEDYKKKLQDVKEKLNVTKKEVEEIREKEKAILAQLRDIDYQISLSEKKIKELKIQEQRLKESIANLRVSRKKTDTQLEHQKHLFKEHITLMYQSQIPNFIPPISYTGEQIFFYVQEFFKKDATRCNELKELSNNLFTKEEMEREKSIKLSKIRKDEESEKVKSSRQREMKSLILKEVRKEKSNKARLVEELEKSRSYLEALIARLEKYPVKKFGPMIWPVRGEVVSWFGTVIDPELGTKLVNNGIDIKAEYGTPVVAVADGEVAYEGIFLGYGKIVLLDHKNGFHTLYAHLSEILVTKGDKVKKGEVIGKVGTTGLLEEPRLHFEVRESGKAVDPMVWLR
ncbi:MAG: peptidoglycan DD-metalloendopeptidase family protein [bacterium]|nr:peptidoglycan DD-metalloendopeptidase family protein [bacterium]